jgi:hypothetical protein
VVSRHAGDPAASRGKRSPDISDIPRAAPARHPRISEEIARQEDTNRVEFRKDSRATEIRELVGQTLSEESSVTRLAERLAALKIRDLDDGLDAVGKPVDRTPKEGQRGFVDTATTGGNIQVRYFVKRSVVERENTHQIEIGGFKGL